IGKIIPNSEFRIHNSFVPLSIDTIRRQFPFLRASPPPVYLDSAAMAQIPDAVLEEMQKWEQSSRSNVHRGMHARAEESTIAYESARSTIQGFIHAKYSDEIIFTKSCTEAINLVTRSWGEMHLQEGESIVVSMLEHHSNIVPWLQLKNSKGIDVLWMDIDENGIPRMEDLERHLKIGRVKLVAITALSNVLGVAPDLQKIISMAHDAGALVLLDAAQAIAHMPLDVQELDCDFLAFSGHKLYGSTGIGVLYGKRKILENMPPFLGGGMMIREVRTDGFTPADLPAKFEAGTPPIAEAVGLAAAIEWLKQFSWNDIQAHEQELLQSAICNLQQIPNLHILGQSQIVNRKSQIVHGCISFTLDGVHPHDLTEMQAIVEAQKKLHP
ncbi:MAG: cysteine desulfurase / selenocysteine lyase, partial [Candidatus Peregrinibacteria bacterium Greene1014_49]